MITPAACYHAYVELEGQRLERPVYLTMRADCCRREADYELLERQWTFSMREIVCVGSESDVTDFLAEATARIGAWVDRLGLGVTLAGRDRSLLRPEAQREVRLPEARAGEARDGLRRPAGDRLDELPPELLREAFAIRADGAPAYSGCVAFGIERWIAAFLQRFGPSATQWPELEPLDG